MIVVRKGNIEYEKKQKQNEITKATAERNSDLIEYLAMMTDVEIPDMEEDENEQEV